jgi:ankyrin repeat protein
LIKSSYILESISNILILNERNIANLKDIEDEIKFFSGYTEHKEVKDWLNTIFRKYLINDYPKVQRLAYTGPNDPEWMAKAMDRGEMVYDVIIDHTLTDEVFNIVSTMNHLYPSRDFDKFVKSPYPEAVKKSEYFQHQRERMEGVEPTGLEYPGGFRWMKLKGYETIKREGELMANCLRKDPAEYARQVKRGSMALYSLWDRNDKPKVTIQVHPGSQYIEQIKGFQNGKVDPEYRKYVFDFLKKGKFLVVRDLDYIEAVEYEGEIYPKEDLPLPAAWEAEFGGIADRGEYGVDLKIVGDLLKRGADPNALVGSRKSTALIASVMIDHVHLTLLLLENKADPNLHNKEGWTPLTLACEKGSISLVKPLLTYKADPNLENKGSGGHPPLFYASLHGDVDIIDALVDAGADVNKKNALGTGVPPIITAAINSKFAAVGALVKHGAEPNVKHPYSKEWLLMIVLQVSLDEYWVKLLLDHGADPNILDNDGFSALQYAVTKRELGLMKVLIDGGANVNFNGVNGTALHTAADYEFYDGAEMLLKSGAKINVVNNWLKSPLAIAKERKYQKMVDLFLKFGAEW